MARGKTLSVVFKSNFQHQGMLLPPDLNELIAINHPVRVVNEVLEKIDISQLIRQYKPGGTSSYHPRLLLKILVYAYINNIYSSRKIEEAVSQNIYYMWLSGMSTPDHNTINRFRGQRLQKTLQPIKCEGCPLRNDCHQGETHRIISINHNLNRLKQKADKRLRSKRGIAKRKQRCFDTEPVFANIKYNHSFKRFMLRGLEKVGVEMGLFEEVVI